MINGQWFTVLGGVEFRNQVRFQRLRFVVSGWHAGLNAP
jgi:hypothetical protein